MSKHTSGPWFTSPSQPTRVLKQFTGGKIVNELVCRTDYSWATENERRANARLIAAAPDLLEALELCREHMYNHASNTPDNAFDKLCAAIRKATGEQA